VATTVGANGRLLEGLLVSFSATRGTLSSSSAVTNGNGEARVTLRTNVDTDITATAGSKTSAVVKVTAQPGPSVQLTCAVGSVTNCATVTQGVAVLFTAQRASSSSVIVSSTLDYGDGASVSLGPLTNPVQASHSYAQNGTYTALLTATDVNGESTTASLPIQVLSAVSSSVSAQSTGGLGVTATATVSAPVVQYAWTFEGTGVTKTTTEATTTYTYASSGRKTVSVTATLTDGRTTMATTTVVVP
jgi:PKD repeat protein